MSDLRGFDAPHPEREGGRGNSRIIAGAIVVLMLGAAGVYVYASNNSTSPQQQKVAMVGPQDFHPNAQPLTLPPAPATDTTTTGDDAAPKSDVKSDVSAPAAAPAPVEKAASMPHATREAHVRTPTRRAEPSTVPAPTPPDTTNTPALPSQPATPEATPPSQIPQAPVANQPPPTVDQTPPPTTPQGSGTPQ